MEIKEYKRNVSPEELTSQYKTISEHSFKNVTFLSAIVENSPHSGNEIAFIIKDTQTGEVRICLEFTKGEALLVIELLAGVISFKEGIK